MAGPPIATALVEIKVQVPATIPLAEDRSPLMLFCALVSASSPVLKNSSDTNVAI